MSDHQQVLLDMTPTVSEERVERVKRLNIKPGRQRGTRGKRVKEMRDYLDRFAPEALETLVMHALQGEDWAMKLYLDRIYPRPQRATIRIEQMPVIQTPADAREAMGALLQQATSGQLALDDAAEMMRMVGIFLQAHSLDVSAQPRQIGGGGDARELLSSKLVRILEARTTAAAADDTETALTAVPLTETASDDDDELDEKFAALQQSYGR